MNYVQLHFIFILVKKQGKVTPLDILEDSAFKTSVRLKGTKLEQLLDNNDDKQFLDIIRKRMRKTVLNKERDLNTLLLSKPVDVSTLINKYEREIVFLDFRDVYHIIHNMMLVNFIVNMFEGTKLLNIIKMY